MRTESRTYLPLKNRNHGLSGFNVICCSYIWPLEVYKSLVTAIVLYDCETWTLLVDSEEKKDPGFRNQVHEETSPYLLLGAQDQ